MRSRSASEIFARLAAPAHPVGPSPSLKEPCKIRSPNCAGDNSPKASSVILGDPNSEHSNGESKDALRFSARQELRSHERILVINSPSKPGVFGCFFELLGAEKLDEERV